VNSHQSRTNQSLKGLLVWYPLNSGIGSPPADEGYFSFSAVDFDVTIRVGRRVIIELAGQSFELLKCEILSDGRSSVGMLVGIYIYH
jgi:hypothetical protein